MKTENQVFKTAAKYMPLAEPKMVDTVKRERPENRPLRM